MGFAFFTRLKILYEFPHQEVAAGGRWVLT